jgi:hypothetical protein
VPVGEDEARRLSAARGLLSQARADRHGTAGRGAGGPGPEVAETPAGLRRAGRLDGLRAARLPGAAAPFGPGARARQPKTTQLAAGTAMLPER